MSSSPKKIHGFFSSQSLPPVKFKKLIDIRQLQHLLEVHYSATGMPSGIIDAETGEVYAGAGWQKICLDFHRAHPETLKNCIASDTNIMSHVKEGKTCGYKCANGLWDIGIPIYCDERHIATYFLGQFHYDDEPVDTSFFSECADRYGFDKSAYLKALDAVPRFTREKVQEILRYNEALAAFLSEMATKNMKLRQELILRTEAEHRLHLVQSYLANVINSMPSMLIGVDSAGIVTFWNSKAEEVTGIEERAAIGVAIEFLLPQLREDIGRIETAMRTGTKQESRGRARQMGHQLRYEDVTIFPLAIDGVEGAVVRIDDVTAQVHFEQTMIQTEKMLTVGGIAAGVAHEINNPLCIIMQAAQLLTQRTDPEFSKNRDVASRLGLDLELMNRYMRERNLHAYIRDIREATGRAATIVRHMLDFSRISDARRTVCSVHTILDRAITFAGSDYDLHKSFDFKNMRIVREFGAVQPLIPCSEIEIEQVFLNLLRNAAQAMGDAGTVEPSLIVRTASSEDRVVIEIEDNGPGIPPEYTRRVFDPFFTTKPPGQGTGLGLSVSYFIVTQMHGGTMSVSSLFGRGSCFRIELPRHRSA